MQRMLVAACFGVALLFAGAAQAQQGTDEEAAVRAAVSRYIEAQATGSGEPLRSIFHPTTALRWVRQGAYTEMSGEQYIASFRGTPAPDEAQRRRTIEMVEVTGTAAIAKVVLDYPNVRYTDYFTLLKIDGQWRIVSKTFNAEPKVAR